MNMKCITLGLALAATTAIAAPASADQLADIMAAKTLRCATFADVPPLPLQTPKPAKWLALTLICATPLLQNWA